MNAEMLVQALPYIHRFRGAAFVVKLGGGLIDEGPILDRLAQDIALLAAVGVKLVVVHGGGPQASALSRSLGHEPKMVQGRRVTDAAALEVAKMTFAGKLSTEVLSALARHGCRAVGLSGIDAGLIKARRRPPARVVDGGVGREVDFGHVGDIEAIDPRLLHDLGAAGYTPVVSSLACDPEGAILNINADTIAAALAAALRAEKLVLLTEAPGVLDETGALRAKLDQAEAMGLIERGAIKGGMRPKIDACFEAMAAGVTACHILDGRAPRSLLIEALTDQGIGTMLVR